MRTRRKPPSLVSMWMLDVFCCALGCVTLLWLLNTRQAGDERARAVQALADLTATKQSLLATRDSAETTHKTLAAEIAKLNSTLAAMTREKNELSKQHATAMNDLEGKRRELVQEGKRTEDLMNNVATKTKEVEKLLARLAAVTKDQDDAMALLKKQEADSADLLAKAKAAEAKVGELDARLTALTKENVDASARLAAMKKTGEELASANAATTELQKKIDDAKAMIVDLQGQKAKLADKYDKLRIDSESRFAGIALTGRRVVFMVDMSGSMKLIDDKTLAPRKWDTVCETVAKVMRSLPELEKYQVIVFSSSARVLYGSGEWLNYDGETTCAVVREKLLSVDPKGDTNVYDAFDLAFKLKPEGLDTIYLFSDGLPTSGPDYTKDMDAKFTDAQRTDWLTKQMKQALSTKWNPPGGTRVKINSIGFFYESPEVGAFLWALSRDNDGSFVGMSKP